MGIAGSFVRVVACALLVRTAGMEGNCLMTRRPRTATVRS